jgi:hypothetical protein
MDNLFDKWKTKIPKYNLVFQESLFDAFSKKGGGSEKTKVNRGKHFSNNYELYIFAFFLGLYNEEFVPIPENSKKVDFSHSIQHWGSKSGRFERKDFTVLQEYIYSALIAKTDVDLIALEKGDVFEDDVAKALIQTMEGYTNGGLTLILEKLEENSNYFLQTTAFLNMILESKLATQNGIKRKRKSRIDASKD